MQLAVILEEKQKKQTRKRQLSLNLPIAGCFNKTMICDTCSLFFHCFYLQVFYGANSA